MAFRASFRASLVIDECWQESAAGETLDNGEQKQTHDNRDKVAVVQLVNDGGNHDRAFLDVVATEGENEQEEDRPGDPNNDAGIHKGTITLATLIPRDTRPYRLASDDQIRRVMLFSSDRH
jgi:hypothetical protein